jgi:hypothetical protein
LLKLRESLNSGLWIAVERVGEWEVRFNAGDKKGGEHVFLPAFFMDAAKDGVSACE